jgi:hypothetical protein
MPKDLALYYCGATFPAARKGKGPTEPLASVRLKHLRSLTQTLEYLHLLARREGWSRARVRAALAELADEPTAAVWSFEKLSPRRYRGLRRRVAAAVAEAAP